MIAHCPHHECSSGGEIARYPRDLARANTIYNRNLSCDFMTFYSPKQPQILHIINKKSHSPFQIYLVIGLAFISMKRTTFEDQTHVRRSLTSTTKSRHKKVKRSNTKNQILY